MRGVGMQFALALACAAAIVGCGGDDDDDGDDAPKAGSGTVNAGGTGGSSGAGASGGGSGTGGMGGLGALPAGATECGGDAMANCKETIKQQTDGVPCCTQTADIWTYGTARREDTCGLFFTGRIPCFELHAPGNKDDECPQMLDQGWGAHDGCCHPGAMMCGIINEDTGCTLFRDTAKKPDGSAIGMPSSGFPCTP